MGRAITASVADYPAQLLQAAEEMFERGQYEVTVVTAQMACEVSVERIFSRYFQAKQLTHIESAIEGLLPSFNLGNDKVRRLYSALTDDHIQREFFWSEYKTMVSIRNKAVHSGERVQRSQAQTTIRVTKLVLKHLAKVEGKANGFSINL